MKVINVIVIFLYTVFFSLIGGLLIALALRLLLIQDITSFLISILATLNLRIVTGAVGLLLVILSLSIARLILGGAQRQRNIAFSNPSGQVTVSLSAIEDFIKRLMNNIPEVKEFKSSVVAGKRSVNVLTRASLCAESNIPEVTEKIQSIIKSRVQEMLGIEEEIKVSVHVVKVLKEKTETTKEEPQEAEVPFQGGIKYGKK